VSELKNEIQRKAKAIKEREENIFGVIETQINERMNKMEREFEAMFEEMLNYRKEQQEGIKED